MSFYAQTRLYYYSIPLPKSMAANLKMITRAEGRGPIELVREALRASLARVSRAGKTRNLAAFIARDRLAH